MDRYEPSPDQHKAKSSPNWPSLRSRLAFPFCAKSPSGRRVHPISMSGIGHGIGETQTTPAELEAEILKLKAERVALLARIDAIEAERDTLRRWLDAINAETARRSAMNELPPELWLEMTDAEKWH